MQQWLAKDAESPDVPDQRARVAQKQVEEERYRQKIRDKISEAEQKEFDDMLRQRLIKIARNQAPEVGPKRLTAIHGQVGADLARALLREGLQSPGVVAGGAVHAPPHLSLIHI